MGLDMYLNFRKSDYASAYFKNDKLLQVAPKCIVDAFTSDQGRQPTIFNRVDVCVAYWRKANQIHNWFVQTLAGGVDECQDIYVPIEKLKELVNVCKEVLEDHSKASILLPTRSGFFFGNTNYFEDYFEDLEYTVNQLTKVIEVYKTYGEQEELDIIYNASW